MSDVRASGFVSLDDLKEAVLRPGIEKHLRPLTCYKGTANIGRIKRLWNYLQLMHLSGVRSVSESHKLFANEDHAQLLGPVKRLPHLTMDSFLSRVSDNLRIAELIPGLPDYVRERISFRRFTLARCQSANSRSHIDWRRDAAREDRVNVCAKSAGERSIERLRAGPSTVPLFYPFMLHDPKTDEAELVKAVHRVAPKNMPHDLRADFCQEMILRVLIGEIARDEIHSKRFVIMKDVLKINGWNDRSMSLSTPVGDGGKTLMEILADTEWVDPWADDSMAEDGA